MAGLRYGRIETALQPVGSYNHNRRKDVDGASWTSQLTGAPKRAFGC